MRSFRDSLDMLEEGGAFGHLSHPYDVEHFTFNDYKAIISNAFANNLEYAREKTDAVNLMFSWKDGHIVAARNKSHLKNAGQNAMSIADVESKFKGRPLEVAYGEALRDLTEALLKLSQKQRDALFQNGRSWMSMEVMMPGSAENVLKYGVTELRLQDLLTYDENGNATNYDPKAARMLDGMIRQKNAEIQKTFHIKMLNVVDIPMKGDFKKKKAYYLGQLSAIMKNMGVKWSSTIADAKTVYYGRLIGEIDPNVKSQLMRRWALNDKSIRLTSIIADANLTPMEIKRVKEVDKNINQYYKKFIFPLEHLFLAVGADILQMVEKVMAINPDHTVSSLKKDLQSTIDKVRSSGDPKLIEKLEYELQRLDRIGGLNAVVPTEGITFFHKGEILKLTGTFAPLNQILGLRFRLEK